MALEAWTGSAASLSCGARANGWSDCLARGRRCGAGALSLRSSSALCHASGICPHGCAMPAWHSRVSVASSAARWRAPDWIPSARGRTCCATPLAADLPAPRCVPERDRSAAAPPAADDHADLCQGGHRGATRHRAAVARECVMSPLQVALDEYLAVRRALGYKLCPSVRPPAATLRRFRRWPGGDVHHVRTRRGMGNVAWLSAARSVGQPAGDGAPLCTVLQCAGAAHGRAAAGLASSSIPPS